MTTFSQETDPQTLPEPFKNDLGHIGVRNVTNGGNEQRVKFPLLGESDPLREARSIALQTENPLVAEQLDKLFFAIKSILELVEEATGAVEDIPPLHAYPVEDGSVVIEWIFDGFRIGFNVEPDPEDSGWHIVSNKRLGEHTASGPLKDIPKIIKMLLSFIVQNI